jgi:hypothetical protein
MTTDKANQVIDEYFNRMVGAFGGSYKKTTKTKQGWVYEGGNWTSDDWAWGGFIMSPEELVNQVVSFYNTPGSGVEKINSKGIKFVGGIEAFTLGDVSEASVAAIVQPRKSIDSLEDWTTFDVYVPEFRTVIDTGEKEEDGEEKKDIMVKIPGQKFIPQQLVKLPDSEGNLKWFLIGRANIASKGRRWDGGKWKTEKNVVMQAMVALEELDKGGRSIASKQFETLFTLSKGLPPQEFYDELMNTTQGGSFQDQEFFVTQTTNKFNAGDIITYGEFFEEFKDNKPIINLINNGIIKFNKKKQTEKE